MTKRRRKRYTNKKNTYVNVVTGFFRMAMTRQTTTAMPMTPATLPSDERAATTAPVSQERAGSGSWTPVAF
jgi:hypothetical protein